MIHRGGAETRRKKRITTKDTKEHKGIAANHFAADNADQNQDSRRTIRIFECLEPLLKGKIPSAVAVPDSNSQQLWGLVDELVDHMATPIEADRVVFGNQRRK